MKKIPLIKPEIIISKKNIKPVTQRNRLITEKNILCQRCHKKIAKYQCEVCGRKVCKDCWANGTCVECCIEPAVEDLQKIDYKNYKAPEPPKIASKRNRKF